MIEAVLHTDGGSRGNPGISGFGFDLSSPDGTVLADGGWFLPRATNNVAEYSALVWGLENAIAAGVTHIEVRADSELMVKQLLGQYKVKSADLKPLYTRAKELFARFEEATIEHVYRSENKRADELANETMDAHEPVGSYFAPWRQEPTNLFDFADEESLDETAVEADQRQETYEVTIREHVKADARSQSEWSGSYHALGKHPWDIEVTFVGQDLTEEGILYDFKDAQQELRAILDTLEQRCANEAEQWSTNNLTAEHTARIIFCELEEVLPREVALKEVAIWVSSVARIAFYRS